MNPESDRIILQQMKELDMIIMKLMSPSLTKMQLWLTIQFRPMQVIFM